LPVTRKKIAVQLGDRTANNQRYHRHATRRSAHAAGNVLVASPPETGGATMRAAKSAGLKAIRELPATSPSQYA